jgi:hypothetical protein
MKTHECSLIDHFVSHFEEYSPLSKTKLDVSLFIHSYDEFVLNLYLDMCIKYSFDSLKSIDKFIGESKIETTQYTITIDLKSIEKFSEIIQYVKEHSSKRSLFGKPTVYILKNVHALTIQQQTVLQNIIERTIENIFIITSYKINKIHKSLVNTFVQLKIPSLDMEQTIQKICSSMSLKHSKKKYKTIIENCESKIFPVLLALDTPDHKNIIHSEYMNLFSMIKKVKTIDSFLTKVRTTMYNLLVFNIPRGKLCTQLMKSIMNKYKNDTEIIITMSKHISNLEHNLIFCSKPIQHYEYCFLLLFELVHR